MLTRSELAELLADEDLSDTAVAAMIIDPLAMLDALAEDIGTGPDCDARREMVAELRAALAGLHGGEA